MQGRPLVSFVLLAALALGCVHPADAPAPAPAPASAPAPAPTPRSAKPGADTFPLFAYQIVPVAPGVHAFVMPENNGMLVSGNSLLVVGRDAALVVDTGHFPSLARKMIADVRRLTDKPVRWVVTTHWHPDHLFGNAAYRDAFPGVVFVAHAETRRLELKNDPQYVESQRKGEELVVRVKEMLRTGMRKGVPLGDDDRVALSETLPVIEGVVGDADGVELVPPQLAFEGSLTLDLGGREVKILHLGRGNTAGDAVVFVPDARVLATGDLVVSPTPYGYDSYFGEWIAALERMMALGATTLVPGHGAVQHDFTYERTLVELFTSLRSQVAAAVKEGLTLEQTRKRVDLSAFEKTLAAGDAARVRAFRVGFVTPGVARAYEEAKGPLSDE